MSASSSNSLYSDAVSDDIEDGTIPLSQSQASLASLVGRLGHLSVEQEEALSKFKEALKAKQQVVAVSLEHHSTSESKSQSPDNDNAQAKKDDKPKTMPVYYSEINAESATIDSSTTKTQADYSYSLYSDANFLRFLRARKFVVNDALKMWIEFINWRTEFNADSLFTSFEFPEYEKVKEIYPRFYHKTDRVGRPVYFEKLGSLDATKLVYIFLIPYLQFIHVI
jgi:hypothetical protein